MRIAYIDCFAGIAGDMFLGALIDAGVPPQVLQDATAALNLGASLQIEKVDRSGISATKVHVLEGGHLADTSPTRAQPRAAAPAQIGPRTPRRQPYAHSARRPLHPHAHGRSLTAIRTLIQAAPLAAPVKQTAIRAFELLGASEARIHNVPIDNIHFHEVGAVDAIVDIVAASAGIHHLQRRRVALLAHQRRRRHSRLRPRNLPRSRPRDRRPAARPAHLLRSSQVELVTPTGAALLRAIAPHFGPQPPMRVERIGYGAGTRTTKGFPNVLRLSIGKALDESTDIAPSTDGADVVTVLETALDDLSPQVLAHVAEAALGGGALDVMLTPVIMKKGRPGTLLTILCNPSNSHAMEEFILRETTTLGIRIRQDRRSCLDRVHDSVSTPYGDIRIKIGSLAGEAINAAPEFEDCRAAAARCRVALKQVQQAAIAAYLQRPRRTESESAEP